MTTATQFTQDQVRANFRAAQKMAEPAVLDNSFAGRTHNEPLITQKMLAEHKEPTAENFYRVINQLFDVLKWSVKPAKLVLQEKSAAPAKVESTLKLSEDRAKTVKAAEVADKYAAEQEEYETLAYTYIDSFLPMTKRGSVDSRKRDEVQALLKKHVAAEKARGVSMKECHKIVAAHIQEEYQKIEKSNERM